MFGKERCELTKKTKGLINEMMKKVFTDEDFEFSELLNTDPRVMMLIGYFGKAMELSYEAIDDMYEHYESEKEINNKILVELVELNKKISYNETIIKDLEKTVKSLKDTDKK